MASIPSIMFHTVGLDQYSWVYPHISEPFTCFSEKISILVNAGYCGVSMAEAVALRKVKPKNKNILLTFDDGYLDNWTFVFPLLQSKQMKGTIFVSPEFVDPRDIIRPQFCLGSKKERGKLNFEDYVGFLSWPEMREMEKSGLIDIQSHALSHTWYPCGSKIVDYWRPGISTEPGGAVWMLWNRFPLFKPYYLTQAHDYEKKIPYGTPIYEHGKSLETRRYIPNEDELELSLVKYVEQCGGEHFFEKADWCQQLNDVVAKNRRSNGGASGTFESVIDHEKRIMHELKESKKVIEQELNKTIEGICWPGGGVTESVFKMAKEVGYKYFTLPSSWETKISHGQYENMIPRIGSMPGRFWKGRDLGHPTSLEFLWAVASTNGAMLPKTLVRITQTLRKCFFLIKSRRF